MSPRINRNYSGGREQRRETKNQESGCEARFRLLNHAQQKRMKRWEFEEVGGESSS